MTHWHDSRCRCTAVEGLSSESRIPPQLGPNVAKLSFVHFVGFLGHDFDGPIWADLELEFESETDKAPLLVATLAPLKPQDAPSLRRTCKAIVNQSLQPLCNSKKDTMLQWTKSWWSIWGVNLGIGWYGSEMYNNLIGLDLIMRIIKVLG